MKKHDWADEEGEKLTFLVSGDPHGYRKSISKSLRRAYRYGYRTAIGIIKEEIKAQREEDEDACWPEADTLQSMVEVLEDLK